MKKSILFSMALIAALSSCTKENVDNSNENNDLVPIVLGTSPKISGTVTPQSRAPLNSWSNTEVGLYALAKNAEWNKNTGGNDTPVLWDNITGTIATGEAGTVQNIKFEGTEYYPKNGTMLYSFYGYYPIGEGVVNSLTTSEVTAKFTIDGTQDIIWGKSVAKPTTGNSIDGYNAKYFREDDAETPQINFRHLLTQLNFQFKRAEGFQQDIQVDSIVIYNVSNELTLTVANRTNDKTSGLINDNNVKDTLSVIIVPDEGKYGVQINNSETAIPVGQPIMLFTDDETTSFSGGIYLVDGTTGKYMTTEPIPFTIGINPEKSEAFATGTSYKVEFTIEDMEPIVVNAQLDTWKTAESVIQGGNI